MSKFVTIERADVARDYGFWGVEAIVEHPAHGRIMLTDGYGEHDVAGGAVRWQHGLAIKLQPADTLKSLHADVERRLALYAGHDDERPLLDWDGVVIARIAKELDL